MVKIIFLDIDGVLCTHRAAAIDKDHGLFRKFDPIGINMLNNLCDRANAKIVVSSTWRKDTDNIHMVLAVAGIHQRNLYHDHDYGFDCNDSKYTEYGLKTVNYVFEQTCRGDQINNWLSKRKSIVDSYIILDDDSDFHDDQKEFLVQTDCYNGISYENYLKAEKLLGISTFN